MPSLARQSLAVVEFVVMTKAPFNYHRPKCAPPSTFRMSPVTVAASVRFMTASVMSLTVEGRPIGDRLSIVLRSLPVKWRVDGAGRDGIHADAVFGVLH